MVSPFNCKRVLHHAGRILGNPDSVSGHKSWGGLCVLFEKLFARQRPAGVDRLCRRAASVWSLLIPAMEQAADLGRLAFFPAAAGFWLGILFLLLLDHNFLTEETAGRIILVEGPLRSGFL